MWMSQAPTRLCTGLLTFVLTLTCSLRAIAAAPLVYVANNGVDSAGCGTSDRPCRSITKAMANAAAGSLIVVGPGRYGDLNSDGKFDSPGEEKPQSVSFQPPLGGRPVDLRCVVCITKPLHLVSRYGAEATVIDAGGAPYDAVQIAALNVTFGDPGRGFTLMNAALNGTDGLGGYGLELLAGPAKVTGNLATNNEECGFLLAPGGEGFFGQPANSLGAGPVTAADDNSIANGCGFDVVSFSGAEVQLSNAAAVGNKGFGLAVAGNAQHSITGSRISGNGAGVFVDGGPFRFTHNLIVANRGLAFSFFDKLDLFPGELNTVTLNDIVGNDTGVTIGQTSVGIRINKNNMYGNGTDGSNCAITIEQNGVDARNNYWGSPHGPGPDPADQWGQEPHCDGTIPNNDALVVATPFSKDPFVIN